MSDVERVANLAQELGVTIAVAESLTCGALCAELGKGDDASDWLVGGVVAYSSRTKFDVLGVDEGPVVTEKAARQMVEGVRKLLTSDAAVAVTGVGGPDPEEGRSPGTVYIAACVRDRVSVSLHHFEGEPSEVVEQTVTEAIGHLRDALEGTPTGRPGND